MGLPYKQLQSNTRNVYWGLAAFVYSYKYELDTRNRRDRTGGFQLYNQACFGNQTMLHEGLVPMFLQELLLRSGTSKVAGEPLFIGLVSMPFKFPLRFFRFCCLSVIAGCMHVRSSHTYRGMGINRHVCQSCINREKYISMSPFAP